MKKVITPFFENVLLIDDEDIDNIINERLLQANYFARNVFVKTNIPAAITFLYKALEKGENIPQVVFLDLNLPKYDGFHFILEYKQLQYKYEELRNTCIVILSAFINSYPPHLLNAHSFITATVNKPLSEEVLNGLKEKISTNWQQSA